MHQEIDRTSFYLVGEDDKDRRIDAFLASRVKDLTRSRIQSLIREGHVKVNELPPKTSYRLKPGDSIHLSIPPVKPYQLEPEPVEFTLIHEDSSLIVLNKPPGLVIHPAPGHPKGTLVHGLLEHCRDLSGIGGLMRPGIVHRLDKDTSGLMVVAKNDYVHGFLSSQFKAGRVHKVYLALIHGLIGGKSGEIDLPISRHPRRRKEMAVVLEGGKRALTCWKKKEVIGEDFTMLEITLITGRTHQIRVHLSHLGYPVVGDKIYGHKTTWWKHHCPEAFTILPFIKRQMLHSACLGFIHPESGEYHEFSVPMPKDMKVVIEKLKMISKESKKDNKA